MPLCFGCSSVSLASLFSLPLAQLLIHLLFASCSLSHSLQSREAEREARRKEDENSLEIQISKFGLSFHLTTHSFYFSSFAAASSWMLLISYPLLWAVLKSHWRGAFSSGSTWALVTRSNLIHSLSAQKGLVKDTSHQHRKQPKRCFNCEPR